MILDGKKLSEKVLEKVKTDVEKLEKKPHLVVILVGNDPASLIYVNNKKRAAEKIGIKSTIINYPEQVSQEELIAKIKELNENNEVTGILVQLPLPNHIDKQEIILAISPMKDVDGFTPENVGKLVTGLKPYFYPATPQGILMLLDEYSINISGANVLVIGRSNIVGKPVAQILLNRNATVTIAHSYSKSLEEKLAEADIIVSAVGKKIVKNASLKKTAVIVDVGIFRDENGKLTGDVDFANFENKVEYISPVPGGVGPMTIASLMYNASKVYV